MGKAEEGISFQNKVMMTLKNWRIISCSFIKKKYILRQIYFISLGAWFYLLNMFIKGKHQR